MNQSANRIFQIEARIFLDFSTHLFECRQSLCMGWLAFAQSFVCRVISFFSLPVQDIPRGASKVN